MVKAFAANDDVAFGDVNLSSARGIPGNHRPGEGGWPTIRYFDQKTGIAGGSYEQKTQRAICDELGDLQVPTMPCRRCDRTAFSPRHNEIKL